MLGQKLISTVQDFHLRRRAGLPDVGCIQRPVGKAIDMCLDFQPGMELQAGLYEAGTCASCDAARVERRRAAIGVKDIGLNPGGVRQPWQDMETIRIRDKKNVPDARHAGKPGRLAVPDRQNGAMGKVLEKQA